MAQLKIAIHSAVPLMEIGVLGAAGALVPHPALMTAHKRGPRPAQTPLLHAAELLVRDVLEPVVPEQILNRKAATPIAIVGRAPKTIAL
jgi:hypothetical protein